MPNFKLEIEYDGTSYCGWQAQRKHKSQVRSHKSNPSTPAAAFGRGTCLRVVLSKRSGSKGNSIQETIEGILTKILQERIRLIGSGRTDAGVHAKAQIANFITSKNITVEKLHRALNGLLPGDIKIAKVAVARLEFHSRFDAKSKLYRYTILNRPYASVFLRNTAYFYPFPLNTRLMQDELRVLLGRHNFKAFAAGGNKGKDTVRTIKKAGVKRVKDLIYIDIEADGFLYNMVRNIVGTLIEIGRGKLSEGSLKRILLSRNRVCAGPTAPARGLCLLKVRY